MIIAITRFKVKNWWYVVPFLRKAQKAFIQAQQDPNCLHQQTYPELGQRVFWTVTAWKDLDSMLHYVRSGAHLQAMKVTAKMASETNSMHYESDEIPDWDKAREILQDKGKKTYKKVTLRG